MNYIDYVKSQLYCNATEEYRSNHITYDYTNEEVDRNIDYFNVCQRNGLSPYYALLFFYGYLSGDYDIIIE